ncbi:MAG: hypothetical protein M5U29_09430 [Anaerolineae bacterium]|nr:hypothetical protein [Anaerolineae bacterium]
MAESPRAGLPRRPPDLDEMPVEELIRLSRALTRRITDQDRQRLTLALRESGDARRLWISAPAMLQQFFAGEIDLDDDLAQRFANAPLLAHLRLVPQAGEPLRRRATAIFGSNDDAATLTVDAALDETAALTFTFTSVWGAGAALPPLAAGGIRSSAVGGTAAARQRHHRALDARTLGTAAPDPGDARGFRAAVCVLAAGD